jgi:putative spermidine/putrescine transport system substrate-binding protein
MAFSQNLDAYSQDLAYAYLNWWLTGPAGAIMARNGAYMAAPRAARQYLSANESGFWYDGKPAVADICDPYGRGVYRAGETREGGSCETRQDQIVIWNSVMSEHNSLVRLWDVITQAAMI